MAKTAFKGTPVTLAGDLPQVGSLAPDFTLTKSDLSNVSLSDYAGKTVVLNIFPSIDTPVCAMSVRKFNTEIGNYENAVVLCVSADLPFAHARFCGAEGLDHVVSASTFRSPGFGDAYGTRIGDGPLAGLMARAVVVIDGAGKVTYTQLVEEISQEPDYDKALAALADKDPLQACTASPTAEHSRGLADDGPCDDGRAGG
ncbi:putative thiol peroxidase [Desulfosarcina ovata subsp. sediminis]|uniref:Thiol peroxidase n=1 Tax=Desulfosarcina ovata subsp. sediminis TaxID=885957 RepID=A0A5K7ZWR8_9BACT|nr:thiol peroxidase [Desulfosarcina ovata]BBO84703.1 putative thiol peroxidase [Desulfosarcina ovata subsp. sediminis]